MTDERVRGGQGGGSESGSVARTSVTQKPQKGSSMKIVYFFDGLTWRLRRGERGDPGGGAISAAPRLSFASSLRVCDGREGV